MFSAAVTQEKGGGQLGLMDILVSLVTAVGPLVGGLVATATSIQVVLLMALVFVVFSLGPLFKGGRNEHLQEISYTKPFALLNSSDSVSNMGFGITEMVATIVWPLFIFFIVKSYAVVGFVISVSLMLVISLDVLTGRLTDRGKHRTLLRAGAISSAIVHLVRIAATSLVGVALVNIASDATHALFRVPWTTEFYRHASKRERGTYIAAMELAVCVGRTILWTLLLLSTLIFSQHAFMLAAFIIGAAGSLLVPVISSKKIIHDVNT